MLKQNKKNPNIPRSSVTVFITCWEKKISKKGGKKIKKESKRINLNSEGLGVFFCCFYKFLPRSEDDTDPDSCGFFPTLGLDWEHCSHLGKVDGPGDEKPSHIFKPAQGGISSLFLGEGEAIFGLLAPGLSQPSGRGMELGKS